MTTYYILHHKPTGGFMPELNHKRKHGYTHTEPSHFPSAPRLFAVERGAKVALTYWLQGKTTARMVAFTSDYGTEYDEDWDTKPVSGRLREEWEIVPVRVVRDDVS